MKRFLAFMLCICLFITGCSGDNESTDGKSSPASEGSSSSEAATNTPSSEEEPSSTIAPGVAYVDGEDYYEFDCSKDLNENGFYAAFDPEEYVTLPENLSITVPYSVHTPDQEAVDSAINDILGSYSTNEEILNRAVEDGDTINIDYVGTLDGVEFQGGSTQGYGTTVIVGTTNYVDNFLQKIIGHMPGDNFDIDITFPDDYGNAELAGKQTVFNITVNYIVGESIMPKLTDDFVSENLSAMYGWTTVEEMRNELAGDIAAEAIDNHLFDYLISNSLVKSTPEELRAYMTNYFIYYHSYVAKGSEITLPQFITNFGFNNMSDMLKDFEPDISTACEEELVVQAAAKRLGITLSGEDLGKYFAEHVGREDYSVYEENFGLPYVKKMALSWKLINTLKEQAVYADK